MDLKITFCSGFSMWIADFGNPGHDDHNQEDEEDEEDDEDVEDDKDGHQHHHLGGQLTNEDQLGSLSEEGKARVDHWRCSGCFDQSEIT